MGNFVDSRYKLVWQQEFEGCDIDWNIWDYQFLMGAAKEFKVVGEKLPDIISVSDSMLHLNSVCYTDTSDPDIKYAVAPTFHTGKGMSFKYGYLEMRARVPFKPGAWPSLWLSSRNTLGSDPLAHFSAEIDVFENFGSQNCIVPNIHKWYNDENGNKNGVHTQYPKEKKVVYRFEEDENLSNEFHIYGFEWTPELISMSIDGKVYATFDISKTFDDDADMSGFHSHMRIMINNHLFTESSRWVPSQNHIAHENNFPMQYDIDYLRLYQMPDIGELNIKREEICL